MHSGDKEALEIANAELYAAVENADLDRMEALWADGELGEDAVCIHPGWRMVTGRGAILRSWALIMANTTYIQFFLTDVRVRLEGDTGIVSCAESILTAAEEGESADFAAGGSMVSTNVFRRMDSGWRLWLHHASPVLAPGGDETAESGGAPGEEG